MLLLPDDDALLLLDLFEPEDDPTTFEDGVEFSDWTVADEVSRELFFAWRDLYMARKKIDYVLVLYCISEFI